MDPVEIMLNLKSVTPYYQPIISAESQMVAGYAVIPVFRMDDGTVQNIEWFFNDPSIPEEFHLELGKHVLEKAIQYQLETDPEMDLFFNYNKKVIMKDRGENLEKFLDRQIEKGFRADKFVLQIKEDFKQEEMDSAQNLFKYLKSSGIRIALYDIGERRGGLDRLAYLKPNIVEIDVSFMKENESPYFYRDVHYSLSLLSQKIGASLLFKEVSTYNQLSHAWRNGGRFYQGDYFSRPLPEFTEKCFCKEKMAKDFRMIVSYEQKKIHAQLQLANRLNQKLKFELDKIQTDEAVDEIALKTGRACTNYTFRVYICNSKGLQLSANAEKDEDGQWRLYEDMRNKNWSWRPYFLENIVRMKVEQKGILSDLYTDISRNEQIRTFSYPLSDDLYIFLDIPYSFLFEQEGLL